jgi:HD-like signal output (HDOD) protein
MGEVKKKRILFVDDEENVLHGLKLMLHAMRGYWDMQFAQSGADAIALLDPDNPFEIIVCDMHMQGMDGEELLKRMMEVSPQTVRFILSGNLDTNTLIKASSVAHQVLAKPCDPHHLRSVLTRAMSLRDQLGESSLRTALLEMGTLPSVPVIYWEIMNEINAPEPSIERVGKIIEKDPGMSAKVLQIVNVHSGPGQRITSISEAASALGLENIKTFVLVAEMFSQAEDAVAPEGFDLDQLWRHGLQVGEYAQAIAQVEVEDQKVIDDSYTAGLLHDVGLLILASKLPEEFSAAYNLAKEKKISLQQAEKDLYGATHAEVGGYLLDLWGLPEPVVEAISYHYFPSAKPAGGYEMSSEVAFSPITAVHIANYFCEDEDSSNVEYAIASVDSTHLVELGMSDRISSWWDVCAQVG